jgi:hypothetical protein
MTMTKWLDRAMFVNGRRGDTRDVRLPRPTKTNQRVLGSAVVGLLALNAWAAALVARDDREPATATVVEQPAPAAPAPRTVTLITTTDGHRVLVDPSTPAGQQAIADAERQGATTQTIPVPTSTTTLGQPSTTRPVAAKSGDDGLVAELPQDLVDDLLRDPGSTVSSLVDGAKTTVSSVLDRGQTTVSSIVDDAQTTVSSVVDDAGSTVSSIVDDAGSTVSSVLHQVTTVPTTAPPATTRPTSLVGSIITTVSTVLHGLSTPTTEAPSSPTTGPVQGAVCGLLAHC